MPRCANCNFNLEHHDERACPYGFCDGCNERVCFTCGCTMWQPCEMECADQLLMCGWKAPGMCNFCFWGLAAELYAEATSTIEQAGGLISAP